MKEIEMNEEQKELVKKAIFGATAVGLIGVGYFIGKEVAFKICGRNTAINLVNWLSSLPDKEEALRLIESLESYSETCTVNVTGISLPK